jgi:hypothetical protein
MATKFVDYLQSARRRQCSPNTGSRDPDNAGTLQRWRVHGSRWF